MRRRSYADSARDEPAALLTSALVLAMFGVLSGIEATGGVMTAILFTLAAVACVGALILRFDMRK